MAKKIVRSDINCKDCKHSYDWQNIGANGEPIFCYCKFYHNGKFAKFINRDGCKEHFEKR